MQGPTIAVICLGFLICLAGFSSTAAPFAEWSTSTFSDLGTFVGGVFGPVALVLVIFQYAATERSNRALNKVEIEARHRSDLRSSIERRTEKLDQALDDSNWLKIGNEPATLRDLIGTAKAYLPDYQIPDFRLVQDQIADDPSGSIQASEVFLLERCAAVALGINQLKLLCIEYDKISGSNVMSEEVRSFYYFAIGILRAKNYPVDNWP